ncbi:MAG TPA: PQQ-binding-like beta-propeller repeat protein [Candidatus Sulfotelmatobacter sp.]|nr:PQQ-binding-like beta-propeller repeat protein [Candidatus Sulfotelmatobacter sp.]
MKNFRLKTSKLHGNKKTITSISLILLLTMTLTIAFVQPSLAQVGVLQPEKTVGYITVAPTLVGVGQNLSVNLWVYPMPTNYAYQPYYRGFTGVTLTFVRPDGTKDTFMPVDGTGSYVPGQTQALGAIYFFYAPNMAGNWSVSFAMPTQNLTDNTGTVQYLGCTSNTFHFTVQTEPVLAGILNGYPWSPLPNPNVYWSYPINSNNREWYQISGDWLGSASTLGPVVGPGQRLWQPYGSGPNTGHIVWKQPLRAGGIIGGDCGTVSYGAQGSAIGTTVMDGRLFVGIPNTSTFECIDLATGKILYTMNGSIAAGGFGSYLAGLHFPGSASTQSYLDPSVLLESSYGHSPTPYLFQSSGSAWNYYDPFTGALMRSIVNVTAGTSVQLVDNTPLAYGVSSGSVYCWNMSKVVNNNWSTGITWKTPLPKPLGANAISFFGASTDAIVTTARNQFWGYDADTGASLWNLTLTYPVSANEAFCMQSMPYFIVLDPVASTFKCYSMVTGTLLWTSTSFNDSPWATAWTTYWSTTNDYNNLYSMFPDGTTRAYSLTTGEEVWRSKAIPSAEYNTNTMSTVNHMVMVGGNIYVFAGYSSQYKINPIPRFAMLVCVNATTGDITWTLNGGIRPSSAANGYVMGTGDFDGNLYCVGKGQTSTSITIQNDVVTNGAAVLIKGNVLDQSPAQPGTPAVADSSMSEWMDYLNMQNATLLNNPPKPDGVTVRLAAVGPNGDVINIGTVTSDSDGLYKKTWTAPTEGEYTVYATFDGSNSYYGSYGETALSVIKASTETSTQQQTIPDYTMTIIGAAIAIIIAVVIAVTINIMILKKH